MYCGERHARHLRALSPREISRISPKWSGWGKRRQRRWWSSCQKKWWVVVPTTEKMVKFSIPWLPWVIPSARRAKRCSWSPREPRARTRDFAPHSLHAHEAHSPDTSVALPLCLGSSFVLLVQAASEEVGRYRRHRNQ